MGDFISNDPSGKSDLFSPPPKQEPSQDHDNGQNAGSSDFSERPTDKNDTSSGGHDDYTANPTGDSWQNGTQGQYQGTYTYDPTYQNPAYAAYGSPQPQSHPNDGFNTASLVLGIVSWGGLILCCGCFSPITAILSIIFGCIGRENGRFNGKGLTGLILSIVCIVFLMVLFALVLASENSMEYIVGDLFEEEIPEISAAILSRLNSF